MKMRKGFTLIELMIVMAIMALLAVSLLPTVMGAQATARDSSRDSAMRSIRMVIETFNGKYKQLPQKAFCIDGNRDQIGDNDLTASSMTGASDFFADQFDGGILPKDPAADISINVAGANVGDCNGYVYIPMKRNANARNNTSYLIISAAETDGNVNYDCGVAVTPESGDITEVTSAEDLEVDVPENKCRYVTGG